MAQTPYIRIADIDVDPDQRDAFVAAVTDEMTESVRVEPGVLALYAVAEKDIPSRLRFFEIYASEAAYEAHLASPHFRTYRARTRPMIRSRTLVETETIQLSAKRQWGHMER